MSINTTQRKSSVDISKIDNGLYVKLTGNYWPKTADDFWEKELKENLNEHIDKDIDALWDMSKRNSITICVDLSNMQDFHNKWLIPMIWYIVRRGYKCIIKHPNQTILDRLKTFKLQDIPEDKVEIIKREISNDSGSNELFRTLSDD